MELIAPPASPESPVPFILGLIGNLNINLEPIADRFMFRLIPASSCIQVFNLYCIGLMDDLSGAPPFNKALIRSPIRN